MATVNPDDLFAVNRNDITYSVEQESIMASLENTDLLAVNRSDVTYKITGKEFIESVLDPLELAPVVTAVETDSLAGDTVYTLIVTENAVGGKQPYTFTYQWEYVNAEGTVVAIAGATEKTYVVPAEYYANELGCDVAVTDSLDFTAEAQSDYVRVSVPVEIETVTLTENNDGGLRPISTDEITSVNVKNLFATGTLSGTGNPGMLFNKALDGDLDTYAYSDGGFYGLTFASAVPVTTSAFMYVGNGHNATPTSTTHVVNGQNLIIDAPNDFGGYVKYDITSIVLATGINEIGCYKTPGAAGGSIYAFEIDGQFLEDGTELTFSGDRDLVFLKAGDAVKQNNSPVTPTTSAITNVDEVDYTGTSTFTNTVVGADPASRFKSFDGNLATYWDLTDASISNSIYGTITFNPPISVASKVEIYAPGSWNINDTYSNQFAYNGGPTQQIGSTNDSNADGSVSRWVTVSTGASTMTSLTVGRVKTGAAGWGSNYAQAIRVDGVILEDGDSILTLQDSTDLDLFEVGDVVQYGQSQGIDVGPIYQPAREWESDGSVNRMSANQYTGNVDGGGGTAGVTQNYSQPIDITTNLVINGNCPFGAGQDFAVNVTGALGVVTKTASSTASGYVTLSWTAAELGGKFNGYSTESSGPPAASIYNYIVDGKTLVSTTYLSDIRVTGISPSTPSITTDGGSWDVGDVVTGPEKNITGTVGSVDATGRTVTLSTFTGGWSANTGNYLLGPDLSFSDDERFTSQSFKTTIKSKNTSTEPITYSAKGIVDAQLLKVAKTSVITVLTKNTYPIPVITPNGNTCSGENFFDGGSLNGGISSGSATFALSFPTPITSSSALQCTTNTQNQDGTPAQNTILEASVNGGSYVNIIQPLVSMSAVDIPGTVGVLVTSIVFKMTRGARPDTRYVGAILVDGVAVLNSESLTFTDDTELDEFPVGQTVTQSGGNTPVSSAITNVGDVSTNQYTNTIDYSPTGYISGTTAEVFDDNLTTGITGSSNGLYIEFKDDFPVPQTNFEIYVIGSGNEFDAKNDANQHVQDLTISTGWNTINLSGKLDYMWFKSNVNVGEITFAAIKVDGVLLSNVGTVLTLTNDTNLANFRVGDAVQRAPITSPVFYTVCNPDGAPTVNASYMITETAVLDMTSTDFQSIPNNTLPLPNGELYKQLIFDLLTTSGDFNINADTTGWTILSSMDGKTWVAESVMSPNGGSIRSVMTNQPNARYLVLGSAMSANAWNGMDNFTVQFNQALIDTWASGSFLPTQLPTSYDILVTAIDEAAPSITTDGGSWSGTDGSGDARRYAPSQEYSDGVITNFQLGVNEASVPNAFDGNLETPMFGNNASGGTQETGSSTWYITLPTAVIGITAVRFYGRNYGLISPGSNAWGTQMYLNGALIDNPGFDAENYGYSDAISVTSLSSFGGGTSGSASGSQGGYEFCEVQVQKDGIWYSLIDSSVPGAETQVTGPSFTTTGTVASVDVAAKTMTFSESAGRWLVTEPGYQADLKLNSVVQSDDQVLADATLYTLLDAEGNVSDITETDPGYQVMVTNYSINADFDIKFPVLLGSGETPDEALPEGAQLSVDIFASNVAGTDEALHGVTGASVTPVDTGAPEGKFKPVIYTGNGTSKTITCGFSPDMVWTKQRNGTRDHVIVDTVRGADSIIYPSQDYAAAATGAGCSFNPDGITFGVDLHQNQDGIDYVAWCFDAGDTTGANYEGTIQSNVRSDGQFSVVQYDGNNGPNTLVGHGLNSAPSLIIAKSTTQPYDWAVYHIDTGVNKLLTLNEANAATTVNNYWGSVVSNTTFGVADANNSTNNTLGMIAYCWAESPTQNFGSYAGNSTVGHEISCGFEPAFVMIKASTKNDSWSIYDNQRPNKRLYADLPSEEKNSDLSFTSTGFTINSTVTSVNGSGETYIYAAFAGTTTRFDSNDANDVAAFNAVKAKLDAYPTNRRAYRGSLLSAIVTSGLTPDQKTYLLRQGSDGNALESGPFDLNGYYPLYDTEEVANDVSANGDSHSHTFGGVEYFMPDTGVTIYHGTYDARDTGTEDSGSSSSSSGGGSSSGGSGY